MNRAPTFPAWLIEAKREITGSEEWEAFVKQLNDAILQQLVENHVPSYNDLSDTEKQLFVNKAFQVLCKEDAFRSVFSVMSSALDQRLNNQVAKQLLEESPDATKSELVCESLNDAAVSLLNQWPDMKYKMQVFFNQSLPRKVRTSVWQLFLASPKIRKAYFSKAAGDPRRLMSQDDSQIAERCEFLLNQSRTFRRFEGSVGAFMAMKSVLSYYHSLLDKDTDKLADTEYLLIFPFLCQIATSLSKRQPPSNQVVGLLVEQYLSFMRSRPSFVCAPSLNDPQSVVFFQNVTRYVKTLDSSLYDHLASVKVTQTTTHQSEEVCVPLAVLTTPVIRNLFVSFLGSDTLLFVWDQYILGLDTPSYASQLLAALTAIFVVLLAPALKSVTDIKAMQAIMRESGSNLEARNFQYFLHQHFGESLSSCLSKADSTSISVDPSKVPAWLNWSSEVIPSYTRTQDRLAQRQALELDRMKKSEEARVQEDQRNEQMRQIETTLQSRIEEESRKFVSEKRDLEASAASERTRREQFELAARLEIERLQAQIVALRGHSPVEYDGYPLPEKQPSRRRDFGEFFVNTPIDKSDLEVIIGSYLLPPAPKVAAHIPQSPENNREVKSPGASSDPAVPDNNQSQSQKINPPAPAAKRDPLEDIRDPSQRSLAEILTRASKNIQKVAHSDGNRRKELDQQTISLIKQHHQDLKTAENEVFGHPLGEDEFNSLDANEKLQASAKLIDTLKRIMSARKNNTNSD